MATCILLTSLEQSAMHRFHRCARPPSTTALFSKPALSSSSIVRTYGPVFDDSRRVHRLSDQCGVGIRRARFRIIMRWRLAEGMGCDPCPRETNVRGRESAFSSSQARNALWRREKRLHCLACLPREEAGEFLDSIRRRSEDIGSGAWIPRRLRQLVFRALPLTSPALQTIGVSRARCGCCAV
jgi:hypothetical protein